MYPQDLTFNGQITSYELVKQPAYFFNSVHANKITELIAIRFKVNNEWTQYITLKQYSILASQMIVLTQPTMQGGGIVTPIQFATDTQDVFTITGANVPLLFKLYYINVDIENELDVNYSCDNIISGNNDEINEIRQINTTDTFLVNQTFDKIKDYDVKVNFFGSDTTWYNTKLSHILSMNVFDDSDDTHLFGYVTLRSNKKMYDVIEQQEIDANNNIYVRMFDETSPAISTYINNIAPNQVNTQQNNGLISTIIMFKYFGQLTNTQYDTFFTINSEVNGISKVEITCKYPEFETNTSLTYDLFKLTYYDGYNQVCQKSDFTTYTETYYKNGVSFTSGTQTLSNGTYNISYELHLSPNNINNTLVATANTQMVVKTNAKVYIDSIEFNNDVEYAYVVSKPSIFNIKKNGWRLGKDVYVVFRFLNGRESEPISLNEYADLLYTQASGSAYNTAFMTGAGIPNEIDPTLPPTRIPLYTPTIDPSWKFTKTGGDMLITATLYYKYNNAFHPLYIDFRIENFVDSNENELGIIEFINNLEINLNDDLSKLINEPIRYSYKGYSYYYETTLGTFLSNVWSSSIAQSKGTFLIKSNKELYDQYSDQDIEVDTWHNYSVETLNHIVSKALHTIELDANNRMYISLQFAYKGNVDDAWYQYQDFKFYIQVNGINRVDFTPKNVYVAENTKLRYDLFDIKYFDGHLQQVSLSDFAYQSYDLLINNVSSFDQSLSQGNKTIEYKLTQTINNFGIVSTTTPLKVYTNTISGISVTPVRTRYIDGQFINEKDMNVFTKKLVSGSDYFIEQVFNYSYTPNKATYSQQPVPIVVTFGNFTATYNINVERELRDMAYYYDKSSFLRYELGELQKDYNMNIVLDETKDTTQIEILNFNKDTIEPKTIIYLKSTDTYWVVKSDEVTRINNETNAMYKHTLKLSGAIDILGARDLTNCGFNIERYTISQMLNRLMSLTDFELTVEFQLGKVIDGSEKLNYLKTFENYTPLSAIKEIFNGYNATPKMYFIESVNNVGNYISKAVIYAISKSGTNDTPIEMSFFDGQNESASISEDNFGSRVVSNVQNCVSAKSIRYPSVGCASILGKDGSVTNDNTSNAYLRLPTKAYFVDKVTFYTPAFVSANLDFISSDADDVANNFTYMLSRIVTHLQNHNVSSAEIETFKNTFNNSISKDIGHYCIFNLENGGVNDNGDVSGDFLEVETNRITKPNIKLLLNSEDYAITSDKSKTFTLFWKQGENYIKDFSWLTYCQLFAVGYDPTRFVNEYTKGTATPVIYEHTFNNGYNLKLTLRNGKWLDLFTYGLGMSCVYQPMHDIKIKVDNDKEHNDSKMYNQNGKLIDAYNVSKLINSYSISCSSSEINKEKTFYNFYDIPKVGQRVKDTNGDIYVINNVSIDFYSNENGNYYSLPCQFNLTKQVACKSTMVNANTKIRDYDCPQQNNVERCQLYRAYLELDYTLNHSGQSVFPMSLLFNLSNDSVGANFDFSAFIKLFDTSFHNSDQLYPNNYFYYLSTSNYTLGKQKVCIVDFVDNNIIGYGSDQANKGFDITKLLDLGKLITTPISYVNDYGECQGFNITLMPSDKVYPYLLRDGKTIPLSRCCAIDSTLYNAIYSSDYSIPVLSDLNYYKDGLEVPNFQFTAEIGDTNGITIANDFFEYETRQDGETWSYVYISSDLITNENANLLIKEKTAQQIHNVAITYNNQNRKVELTTNGFGFQTKGTNLGFYLKKVKNGIVSYRFLFAINNVNDNYSNKITLYLNNYNLK